MIKPKYADEYLAAIDKATGDEKIKLLKQWGGVPPLNMLFSLNFNENVVVNLPEGMPPYNRDESKDPDLFETHLAQQIKRMANLLVGRSEHIPKMTREWIFLQILEGIPPKEADTLVFAKDKALTELYPTITKELVESVWPAFCAKKRT